MNRKVGIKMNAEYLKKQRKGTLLNRVLQLINRLRGFEPSCEDAERLPKQGPFLVVSNHFGGETPILLGLCSGYDVHLVASEELNWKRSSFRAWLMRKLRMISVKDSLNLLSEKEKEELLKRVPKRGQKGYRLIIQREKRGYIPDNRDYIEQSLALLSRGDVLVIYPEGLFLYNGKKELHQGYRGLELIAKYYEESTSQKLLIVPVAILSEKNQQGRRIRIGKPLLLSKNQTTDWVMTHLAQLLPEDQRGFYKNTHL